MKHYREERVTQVHTDRIFCNLCGKEIKKDAVGVFHDFIEIRKEWGYLSDFDGETHCFDLCGDCYKRMAEKFVYKPEVK